jgi:hypothetical protein
MITGVQDPRIIHTPRSTIYNLGDEAIDLAASAGLHLFDWEKTVLRESLGVREDGKWSAFEVGLMVSRQNGKGSILEARELAGLFLFGEMFIVHSAHLFDTSQEAFERLLKLIESNPDLDREVMRVSRSHGDEGITLRNKQKIRFRTRTKGGGRGFTGDLIILDEAMYLAAQAVAALIPTMSAKSILGNPQLWYTGSAGDKDSTQFGAVRARAIKGEDPSLSYLEWSINHCNDFCDPELRDYKCPDHDPIDKPKSWAIANPSMGITISQEHMEKELRSMGPAIFKQERLGIGDWPTPSEKWKVVSEENWFARSSELRTPQRPFTFAIDTNPDRSHSCILAVGDDGEGEKVAEITSRGEGEELDYRPGMNWVIERAIELNRRWKPRGFVIDITSQAGEFIPLLEAAKIKVISPTAREYAQACGKMYTAIVPGKNNIPYLWHRDQEDLNNAVRGADKRQLAGLWALDRQNVTVDISPLVCMTLALWGHGNAKLESSSNLAMAWG